MLQCFIQVAAFLSLFSKCLLKKMTFISLLLYGSVYVYGSVLPDTKGALYPATPSL